MGRQRIPRPFQPRNLPCPRNCGKFFVNASGIKSHMHVHYREDRWRRQRGQNPPGQGSPSRSPLHSPRHRSRSPSRSPRHPSRSPSRSPSLPNVRDDLWDEDFERYEDFGDATPPTSTPHPPDLPVQQERVGPFTLKGPLFSLCWKPFGLLSL